MRNVNTAAIGKLGWIIRRMQSEAKRRDAAVYRAENATKESPFHILVFTMLSARTRDEATLNAVERLIKKAKTPSEVMALSPKKLERLLYGVGFYRTKAKHLSKASRIIVGAGHVPDTLEGLLALPGVGRKTANIVLARAFGKSVVGVDVHVHRISNRLGIVRTKKPEETERSLTRSIPPRYLRTLNRDFVAFGQTVCLPRKPHCPICPIKGFCWRVGLKTAKRKTEGKTKDAVISCRLRSKMTRNPPW
ncbi:endonuclease III [Candidatus Micrarchaeota archaeon]|nr:endonuclease III [Candidatus Micrarchaeota archaeon]